MKTVIQFDWRPAYQYQAVSGAVHGPTARPAAALASTSLLVILLPSLFLLLLLFMTTLLDPNSQTPPS